MLLFGIIWIFLLEKTLCFVDSDTIADIRPQYCADTSEGCAIIDCSWQEAKKNCPKKCGGCRICEDTKTDCTFLKENNLCTSHQFLQIAAETCPGSCNFCTPCYDTNDTKICEGLKRYCNNYPTVVDACKKTCNKCKAYNMTDIIEKFGGNQIQTTSVGNLSASTTTSSTTTSSTTTSSTTLTTTSSTTATAIVSRDCDKFGVISSVAKGNSVSYTGTSTCPDGVHQPSEALVQKYCGAPNTSSWIDGDKVIKNCQNVPHYTAIAALTFGGPSVAGVFIKCESGGFQVAIQTCQSQLQLYHVSTNATANIPTSDKFALINWKN
ncbi:uncharacterized protein LOC132741149 [Ruditapes philippinarum]|uniref:uncharacterized protein LOC132741149 n=1 Tax=Ruditapes philippinarum TaxID=129788 RepID=UPI00295BC5EC|nr:uncharacterized protein LOC132741149 [Ruditapes philippinarum]